MDNRIGLRKIEQYVILIWSITILDWISSTRKTVIFDKSMFEMIPGDVSIVELYGSEAQGSALT